MKNRFTGCLLGLALGDALGAPFEGMPPGNHIPQCNGFLRYTDDTEMMINLSESILETGDISRQSIAEHFCSSLTPTRGYGPGTLKVLSLIKSGVPIEDATRKVFPDGSLGNGAAMRVAPLGLLYHWNERLLTDAVSRVSTVTHVHPVAIDGAMAIALTVGALLRETVTESLLEYLVARMQTNIMKQKLESISRLLSFDISKEQIIEELGHGVLTHESVPTAIYAFFRFGDDFMETMRFCIGLGGDTDTIAAMAGALTGVYLSDNGLPDECLEKLENYSRIKGLAERLYSLSLSMAG